MKKRILVFAPFCTHPCSSGPSTRLIGSIGILEAAGHEVHYAYLNLDGSLTEELRIHWGRRLHPIPYAHPSVSGNAGQRWRARFRKWLPNGNYSLKQNALIDDWFDHSIEPVFRKLIASLSPDVVICHYVWLSRVLDWTPPQVLKIIDTHDRFSDRYRIAQVAGKRNDWFSTWPGEERRGLQRADMVLAITEDDHRHFRTEFEVRSILHVPISRLQQVPLPDKQAILFIGNRNAANTRALEWFLERCWNKIRTTVPEVELLVAGSVCETVSGEEGVVKLGRVDDLKVLYQQCRVAINPVPSGSGLAIKCLEAFSYGRPVVATSAGARGLGVFENRCIFVSDSARDFSQQVILMFEDDEFWSQTSARCHSELNNWNQKSSDSLLAAIELTPR